VNLSISEFSKITLQKLIMKNTTTLTRSKIANLKPNPRSLVLGDFFKEGDFGVIRGNGSSWFALALAVKLSTGKDLVHWNVGRPQRVLLLTDPSVRPVDLVERLASLAEPIPGKLRLAPLYGKSLSPIGETSELEVLIETEKPEVVIVDSMSRLDHAYHKTWLRRLTEKGISVVAVADAAENTDGADWELALTAKSNSDNLSCDVSFSRNRNSVTPERKICFSIPLNE
jgi:hypothetical protein